MSDILKKVAIGATIGAGAVIATPLVLGAIGFTSAGIAAGSFAASAMSYLGSSSIIIGVAQSVGAAGVATSSIVAGGACGVIAVPMVSKVNQKLN